MQKREQKFVCELQKWLKYYWKETCFIEAKVSVDDKPFNLKSGFKEHQLPTLLMIRDRAFSFKPSDMIRLTQPYDIAFSFKAKSYIAIMWIRKGNKTFYLINPIAIQGLLDDNIKSLTEPAAAIYADFIGTLK